MKSFQQNYDEKFKETWNQPEHGKTTLLPRGKITIKSCANSHRHDRLSQHIRAEQSIFCFTGNWKSFCRIGFQCIRESYQFDAASYSITINPGVKNFLPLFLIGKILLRLNEALIDKPVALLYLNQAGSREIDDILGALMNATLTKCHPSDVVSRRDLCRNSSRLSAITKQPAWLINFRKLNLNKVSVICLLWELPALNRTIKSLLWPS